MREILGAIGLWVMLTLLDRESKRPNTFDNYNLNTLARRR